MLFSEIPGNNQVKKQLVKSTKSNKVGHAQLFLGNSGSGKLALAFAYAQFLNCEQKLEWDSCNKCNSCIKHKNLTHPDIHLVFPTVKTNKIKNPISDNFVNQWRELIIQNPYISLNEWTEHLGDKNKNIEGSIYKDEASSIHKKLGFKNYEALYRVVLIWLPEKMNKETSNKLLKVLEEPPKKTVFLLVSENTRGILETIKSRVQVIKIRDFSAKDIVEYFKSKKMSLEDAIQLRKETEGNLGKIIQKVNNTTYKIDLFERFSKWMRLIYKTDFQEISNWTDEISAIERKHQKEICEYSIKIIRECIIYTFASNTLLQLQEKELKFVEKFSKFIHEENAIPIIEKLEETIKSINRNGNPKIIFFELSLQMIKFLKLKRKFAIK